MFHVPVSARCLSRAVAGAGDNMLLRVRPAILSRAGVPESMHLADHWTLCRIHNPYERSPWDNMVTIKQKILRIWDDAASAVKLCCVKFAQRVVLAQTTATSLEKVRATSSRWNIDLLGLILTVSSA